jgi:hypothetical protein
LSLPCRDQNGHNWPRVKYLETSGESAESFSPELPDFSLILGGPLFQLLRRAHLFGDVAELVTRRVIALALITWLPLLAFSIAEGHAWGDNVRVPFLFDVDVHARFLLALPLLIVAELVVHQRMRLVVGTFVKRGLVPDEARGRFDAAIAAAMRLRNSVPAEVLLIAIVYGLGVLFIWRRHAAMDVPTWYGMTVTGKLQPTLAGWWLGCVSLPLVQFILLRWYFRLLIWTRFLWQVSRIDLRLVAIHPDRAGGLGFLSTLAYAFAPLLLGQGVLLAGVMANKIFYAGAKLTDFKLELLAMVIMMLFFVLGPLLVFIPRLVRTKRVGLAEYGGLAQRYVREFDHKWLRGGAPADEPLVGSGDIQSLADLGNSFEIVKGMKPVPFGKDTLLQLAVISLAPVAPLVLTMIPLGELLDRFLHVVF